MRFMTPLLCYPAHGGPRQYVVVYEWGSYMHKHVCVRLSFTYDLWKKNLGVLPQSNDFQGVKKSNFTWGITIQLDMRSWI